MLRLTEEATRQFLKKAVAIWCALIVAALFFISLALYYQAKKLVPALVMWFGFVIIFFMPWAICQRIFYQSPRKGKILVALWGLSFLLSLGLLTLVRWIAYFYF